LIRSIQNPRIVQAFQRASSIGITVEGWGGCLLRHAIRTRILCEPPTASTSDPSGYPITRGRGWIRIDAGAAGRENWAAMKAVLDIPEDVPVAVQRRAAAGGHGVAEIDQTHVTILTPTAPAQNP
jgi:hypothetical protein